MMYVLHEERRTHRAASALAVALFVNLLLTPMAFIEQTTGSVQASDQGTNAPASSVLWTIPANGETNVSLDQEIIMQFSDPVNVSASPIFSLTPDASPYSFKWSPNDTYLTWDHARLFEACIRYDALAEWVNSTGDINSYNWTFWTTCYPSIVDTYPPPLAIDVLLDEPIFINFSEPMDNTSMAYELKPSGIIFAEDWYNGDTTVALRHTTPFAPMTVYEMNVTAARSKLGYPLVPGMVPNPWRFATSCPPCLMIKDTYPPDGAKDVPVGPTGLHIFINFTEPVDTSTFVFVLIPPPMGPPIISWSNGNKTVEIVVIVNECTVYTASVSARDIYGLGLFPGPVPNPWSFTTMCPCCFITSTYPPDGAVNVPLNSSIYVDFSDAIDISSFVFNLTPPAGVLSYYWYNSSRSVEIKHSSPFVPCATYTAHVLQARDTSGGDLVPGPVPNPWNFTGCCGGEVRGLQVQRIVPNNVRLTWNPSCNATSYIVYSSTDRLAPWPWPALAMVTTTEMTIANHLSDGLTHFYLVRGIVPGGETTNSTMGVLLLADVKYQQDGADTLWFSLPYNTIYRKASDITGELTSSKVVSVTRLDPATQRPLIWFYFRGKWRGTDFAINPGEGFWLGVASDFTWAVNGTDSTIPLTFTYRQLLGANYYSTGLPYTSGYATASGLVLSIAGGLGPGNCTKIDALIKWDYAGNVALVYECTAAGWGGVDFVIMPGDSLWIRITSDFTWTPELITPEMP